MALIANKCRQFCNGAENKPGRMVANIKDPGSLTVSPQPHSFFGLKKHDGGGYVCPLGCSSNPTTKEAAENVKKNSGQSAICQQNRWY